LVATTPAFFSLSALPVEYDPEARCSAWSNFLSEVLPDYQLQRIIQQIFGYCLVHGQPAQRFFILCGEANNGKSVVLQVLTRILGQDNVSDVPLENFGQRFALSSTIGKLANICDDLSGSDKVAEGVLKRYTGGRSIEVERKHENKFTMRPSAKLVYATNQVSKFRDKTQGIWRRLFIVPMKVEIPQSKRVPLDEKVEELCQELPGILNWSLAGLYALHHQRYIFIEPAACQSAKSEHQRESNPTIVFLSEHLENSQGDNEIILCADLYGLYREWMVKKGYQPLGESGFGKELARKYGNRRKRIRQGEHLSWAYEGLRYLN